jgi:hypothetical protein
MCYKLLKFNKIDQYLHYQKQTIPTNNDFVPPTKTFLHTLLFFFEKYLLFIFVFFTFVVSNPELIRISV